MTRTSSLTMRKMLMLAAAMLLALGLSALAASQRANASIFYTVNSAGDEADANPGDGFCETVANDPTAVCTLRAAIQESNANPASPEVIFFKIPGTGVHTIQPKTELPQIKDAVTIDGYSQDGASVNTLAKGTNAKLMIQLDGSQVSGYYPSGLYVDAPDVEVKGLVINRFLYNVQVGNAAANTKIDGNFIGTYPSGTKAPSASGNGVLITDYTAPTSNYVGGSALATRNLISGNGGFGVSVFGSNYNAVQGNLIGTQRDGKSPRGNGGFGVSVTGNHNLVGGGPGYANTIAFNKNDGTVTYGGSGNEIFSNSVFSNGGLGINLVGGFETPAGVTANDKGDADTGSNNLQNKPVLASAKKNATGKTVVKGTLNSEKNRIFYVQFFSNPKGTDEGKQLLGFKPVSTDGSGNASFRFVTKKKVGLGQNITATATSDATSDTSEFSAPKKVVAS
jgi:CSLREA domain-containing protein